MQRENVSRLLADLHLSQLCLSQLCDISTSRISRFLGGSLQLDSEEVLRLSRVLSSCWHLQSGLERLCPTLPINWNECTNVVKEKLSADPEAVRAGWNDLEADVEFFAEREIAALTIAVPLSAMVELMGGSDKFIKIGRGEMLNLLRIKIENPETPTHDRESAKNLLTFVPVEGEDAESLQAVLETK